MEAARSADAGLAKPVMGLRHERPGRRLLPVRQRARQLSAQQRESMERDGYLMVPSLLNETVTARMTSRLAELVRQAVAAWAADPAPDVVERGVVHAKLGLADPDFASCCDHPLLAAAATAALGPDWHLGALSLRAPCPAAATKGCIPTSNSAGPRDDGRRCRPCGASPPSPRTTGRCGSSPAHTGSVSRRSTCWRSDRAWARIRMK
jgi:hypothetical protein